MNEMNTIDPYAGERPKLTAFYPRAKDLLHEVETALGRKVEGVLFEEESLPHDVPNPFFKGPF